MKGEYLERIIVQRGKSAGIGRLENVCTHLYRVVIIGIQYNGPSAIENVGSAVFDVGLS